MTNRDRLGTPRLDGILTAAVFALSLLVIAAGMLGWPLTLNFGLTALMFAAAFGLLRSERRGRRRR
jgi:hypothetical protein